jgi:hypothetical protein
MLGIFDKLSKTGLSARICAESLSHSTGCMAMQSVEIYGTQTGWFTGYFAAGFTRQTSYSRRARLERCGAGVMVNSSDGNL